MMFLNVGCIMVLLFLLGRLLLCLGRVELGGYKAQDGDEFALGVEFEVGC